MGAYKGKAEYDKYLKGISLTRKEAILSCCYQCNGEDEGGVDCMAESCPLYEYMPYNPFQTKQSCGKKGGNPEALKRAREAKRKDGET